MKTYYECIPCFVRQTLDAVRSATDDETIHEQVLRNTLHAISEMDLQVSPPAMGHKIHRFIRECAGEVDPYRAMKDQSNQLALSMFPRLASWVVDSSRPLEIAVRLAIAGNIMDVAVHSDVGAIDLDAMVEQALTEPLQGDIEAFASAVSTANTILYLADNAGEIVFDRLLIEQLPLKRVTLAVRGMPVINDATRVDAQVAGLTELVEVIDNGTDVPGTILEACSTPFRARFAEADLIIAKGQGNYETLSEVEKDIFFVLKAKCPVIARDLACEVGSLVLRRSDVPAERCACAC